MANPQLSMAEATFALHTGKAVLNENSVLI
jgi:hypothetical protein